MDLNICVYFVSHLLYSVLASENLALNKTTIQSITGASGWSRYAVDGNPDPEYYHFSCTFSMAGPSLPYAWWVVDLVNVYEISHVVITRRTGFTCNDLHLEMYMVSPVMCQDQPSVCTYRGPELTAQHNLTCQPGAVGRYLMIRHSNAVREITLCEAEVYGEKVPVSPVAGTNCSGAVYVPKESGFGLAGDGVIQSSATRRVACAKECMATGQCVAYSFNPILGKCVYSAGLVLAYPASAADWEMYRLC